MSIIIGKNFVVRILPPQPIFTFYKIITGLTGMLSLVMIFFCYNPGIFDESFQDFLVERIFLPGWRLLGI